MAGRPPGALESSVWHFNLYNNGTPSVYDYDDSEEQLEECQRYTVEDLFCCGYAPYFGRLSKSDILNIGRCPRQYCKPPTREKERR